LLLELYLQLAPTSQVPTPTTSRPATARRHRQPLGRGCAGRALSRRDRWPPGRAAAVRRTAAFPHEPDAGAALVAGAHGDRCARVLGVHRV